MVVKGIYCFFEKDRFNISTSLPICHILNSVLTLLSHKKLTQNIYNIPGGVRSGIKTINFNLIDSHFNSSTFFIFITIQLDKNKYAKYMIKIWCRTKIELTTISQLLSRTRVRAQRDVLLQTLRPCTVVRSAHPDVADMDSSAYARAK